MVTIRYHPYRWYRRSEAFIQERRQLLRVLTPEEINQRYIRQRQQIPPPVPVGMILRSMLSQETRESTGTATAASDVTAPIEVIIHTPENAEVILPEYEDSDDFENTEE